MQEDNQYSKLVRLMIAQITELGIEDEILLILTKRKEKLIG